MICMHAFDTQFVFLYVDSCISLCALCSMYAYARTWVHIHTYVYTDVYYIQITTFHQHTDMVIDTDMDYISIYIYVNISMLAPPPQDPPLLCVDASVDKLPGNLSISRFPAPRFPKFQISRFPAPNL